MFYRYFLIGIGGFLGAISRVVFVKYANLKVSFCDIFLGILIINSIGGFLMGVVSEAFSILLIDDYRQMKDFIISGYLGGFTTFSAFTYDIVQLLERQKYIQVIIYITVSALLSVLCFYLGMRFVRLLIK